MRLLLDTHVVLWWFEDSPEINDTLDQLLSYQPDVFISPVALWEITIKSSKGKLSVPDGLVNAIVKSDFIEHPIRHSHAIAAGRLPEIHRDPFDRLLIAQAQCDSMTLVTRDGMIPKYDVDVLPA